MASGFRITGQVSDQVQNTQAGQTVTGTQVYFITGDGNEGSVFVQAQHYSAATVRKMCEAQATLIDDVGRINTLPAQGS